MGKEDEQPKSWPVVIGGVIGALACLYVFLVGLELLGDGFKCLGGRGAGGMFEAISNPIAGLMTGILATVLVQSSSTSTSIVVGLVGAEQITVKTGIPIIMGANIGTSVTNTLVSMGQSGDRVTLQRAFSGATVHDMFNMLTVLTLLPIEVIFGAIEGEGGPLFWITKVFADVAMENGEKGDDPLKDKSPTKIVTSPLAKAVISNNKYIINALSLGAPASFATMWANVTKGCAPLEGRRLEARAWELEGEGSRALLSRRLEDMDCSRFYCVVKDLDKNLKKIDEKAYKTLVKCSGYISEEDEDKCGHDYTCYMNAGAYYTEYVDNKQIIKGGFTEGAGDVGGGIIALILAFLLLCGGLVGLCKILKVLMLGTAKKYIIKATKMNDYVAMLIGVAITIVVQSSSVTTSSLTPLCGIGVLPLAKMLPMTLGANIGTTATALIASIAAFTHDAVHIALCHLFFNIIGILIWFPVPIMRRLPLGAAKLLGLYASHYRGFPAVYVLVAFVGVPGVLLGLSAIYDASVAGGVVVTLILLAALVGFEFWWLRLGGCYKVLSEEARRERQEALEAADAELAETDQAAQTAV